MFPWRTVGMHVPSSSSHVSCVQRMGDCRKTNAAMLALMTLVTPWFSSVPLKSLMKGPMDDSGVVKLYDPSPTPCL
jgi:hypothetical protein